MREWLVIESSAKNMVFAPPDADRKGYIPRDVAERLLGRDLGGLVWFTREESVILHGDSEWRDTEPEGAIDKPLEMRGPSGQLITAEMYESFLNRVCVTKRSYRTLSKAAIALRTMIDSKRPPVDPDNLVPYHCPYCGKCHLGHRGEGYFA